MKTKTLAWIFGVGVMVITFSISIYVLYYIFFAKDIGSFNILFLWFGCAVMIMSPFSFRLLADYCDENEGSE